LLKKHLSLRLETKSTQGGKALNMPPGTNGFSGILVQNGLNGMH
jgi:hypothetical protein